MRERVREMEVEVRGDGRRVRVKVDESAERENIFAIAECVLCLTDTK